MSNFPGTLTLKVLRFFTYTKCYAGKYDPHCDRNMLQPYVSIFCHKSVSCVKLKRLSRLSCKNKGHFLNNQFLTIFQKFSYLSAKMTLFLPRAKIARAHFTQNWKLCLFFWKIFFLPISFAKIFEIIDIISSIVIFWLRVHNFAKNFICLCRQLLH